MKPEERERGLCSDLQFVFKERLAFYKCGQNNMSQ